MKQRQRQQTFSVHSRAKRGLALLLSGFLAAAPAIWQEKAVARQTVHAAAQQACFYVSPTGSDSNDGSLAKPFRTLAKARDTVRAINQSMQGDITVYLRGGDYRLTEPVTFDPRDSATNGFRITYQAYENETPVLNGAEQVTGWKPYNEKLYVAPLSRSTKLRNLYVNDKRANMGSVTVQAQGGYGTYGIRAGQADWAWDSGEKSDGVVYKAGDLPAISSNFDDLEIVNGTTWNENIVCTRDVRVENGSVILLMQQPYGAIAQTPGWGAGFTTSGTHTIYNALSFVDSPGEFYFDKTAKMLYYYPRSGEDMTKADVEAPIAEQLLVIAGESRNNRVENLSFRGITFENTDYQLTEVAGSHGKTTCQAAQTYTAFADSNWHSKKYEMVDTLPAMIHITSSDAISLTGNTVQHSGADGISMTNDVIHSEVSGNYVTDITSSGITVGHPQHIYIGDGNGSNREKYPAGVEGICKDDKITNNLLYDISVVHGFGGCAAITVYFADSVKILYNQIEKTAYNGIHLGWGWCNFLDSTTCRDNQICYNRVINSLNRLHDSGGIYTIGQMPGTIINENYVQGIPAAAPYQPTYGLHNDEGTAYVVENDNVLEISPDVTYTINCEDYGKKHDLTILRTYATVCKMGIDPPDSTIDRPIVVSDNVWPLAQYKICLASGIPEACRSLLPTGMLSEADYAFPASCATKGGSILPIRSAGSANTVWLAPDATTSFAASSSMTKAAGTGTSILTPEAEGEYRLYVVNKDGQVLSKSSHLLRIRGSASQVDASAYTVQSGVELENCSEGGQDVAYIENGDYIGFSDVDFGAGADAIAFRVASTGSKAAISVHLDKPDGPCIGTCSIADTGGWQTWATQSCALTEAAGIHDLYFVFTGGEGYLFNLQWWKLNLRPVEVRYGDLNGDGLVNALDLTLLKRALLRDAAVPQAAADLDGSGALDAEDAAILRDFLLGRIAVFPVMAGFSRDF